MVAQRLWVEIDQIREAAEETNLKLAGKEMRPSHASLFTVSFLMMSQFASMLPPGTESEGGRVEGRARLLLTAVYCLLTQLTLLWTPRARRFIKALDAAFLK